LLFQSWTDEHLEWNPLNYGNLTQIQFHSTELWRPDIMAYNMYQSNPINCHCYYLRRLNDFEFYIQLIFFHSADKGEIDHFGNTLLIVYQEYNSTVIFWVPPASFQVRCNTDYLRWPYDSQFCYIYLGSWTYNGFDVNLTLGENHTEVRADESIEKHELLSWKSDHLAFLNYFLSMKVDEGQGDD